MRVMTCYMVTEFMRVMACYMVTEFMRVMACYMVTEFMRVMTCYMVTECMRVMTCYMVTEFMRVMTCYMGLTSLTSWDCNLRPNTAGMHRKINARSLLRQGWMLKPTLSQVHPHGALPSLAANRPSNQHAHSVRF
jgi:hypothetical protein